MKTILVVLGTRPEAIKLAPVIWALKAYDGYRVLVCNTEQQKELSNQTLGFFGIVADFNLNVMQHNQTLAEVQSRILLALTKIYAENEIDATVVQGDTMTVLCGALASFYKNVPVFHVEAGLRSYNLFEPFPEEAMRQMTSRITELHFAPTVVAVNALKKEGILEEKIFLTGNTSIDALNSLPVSTIRAATQKLSRAGINLNDRLVLVTVHRRENHGARLTRILRAIVALADRFTDHQFVVPVHPNPNVHDQVYATLGKISNVVLTKPMDYPELVCMMENAKLVLTDSGGVQEEAPTFGVPVLVLRYETERKEGIDAGFAELVGADADRIVSRSNEILSRPKSESRKDGSRNPYGDGKASKRIVSAIGIYFKKENDK